MGIVPFSGTKVGFNGYSGDYNDKDHKMNGFDVDWKFTTGPFELLGENAFFYLENGGVDRDDTTLVPDYFRCI